MRAMLTGASPGENTNSAQSPSPPRYQYPVGSSQRAPGYHAPPAPEQRPAAGAATPGPTPRPCWAAYQVPPRWYLAPGDQKTDTRDSPGCLWRAPPWRRDLPEPRE